MRNVKTFRLLRQDFVCLMANNTIKMNNISKPSERKGRKAMGLKKG